MYQLGLLLLLLTLTACNPERPISSVDPTNWEIRRAALPLPDSLLSGATYLSSYSQIYTETEHHTFDLTGTISVRNINLRDSIFIRRAAYYGTAGELVRTYFADPIVLRPLETVAIIIDTHDRAGGTGDNFYFEWSIPPGTHEPLFEGIFISTYGQQGISFTTRGVRVE
ncbi:hypothetical protein GGR26_002181 [Lewinella marina]|uniref:DUF3124 domain-containing protein n=1 Tax=Neolewinella marina TaxID=438751 RepID=A0A2G0CGM9_9BACT|nr:DUF3124 domain-containing protein [Neolewinella marina]NJB86413.1 hypothetical protein [Neolewinella marina]PHK99121.1 hypothetical protein CGL56_06580 [Neolewinella marina]